MVKHLGIGNTLGLCLLLSVVLWLFGIPFYLAMIPFIVVGGMVLLPLLMLYIYEKRGE